MKGRRKRRKENEGEKGRREVEEGKMKGKRKWRKENDGKTGRGKKIMGRREEEERK